MTEICVTHGVRLESDIIKVRYGLPPAPPIGYFEAEETLFPYANSWKTGGCVITDEDGIDQDDRVTFCPECRLAQKSWLEGEEVEDFWRAG